MKEERKKFKNPQNKNKQRNLKTKPRSSSFLLPLSVVKTQASDYRTRLTEVGSLVEEAGHRRILTDREINA